MKTHRAFLSLSAAVLLAACNGHSGHLTLVSGGNTSIDDGAIEVADGRVSLHPDQAPEATIDGNGDFAVDGKAVAVTPAQRSLLVAYHDGAVSVREHGIATGKAGTAIAGEAIEGAVSSIAGGKSRSVEDRVQAQTEKVKQAALKICDDLARIRAAQDQLAAQLPAFKPYGTLLGADAVADCRQDDD